MLTFLTQNLATILVSGALLAIVVLVFAFRAGERDSQYLPSA